MYQICTCVKFFEKKTTDMSINFVSYILISVRICSVDVRSKEDCPQCSVAKEWGKDGCFYHIPKFKYQ